MAVWTALKMSGFRDRNISGFASTAQAASATASPRDPEKTPRSVAPKSSVEPRSCFLDLPANLRELVCQIASNLSDRLDKILATGQLKATNIIPLGKEILDLSSLCCVINRMLTGLGPYSMPAVDELNDHVTTCMAEQCCSCCSAMAMMDLEGELLRSFPDDDDDAVVPKSIHAVAMAAVIQEVEKALAALDSLLYQDTTVVLRVPRRQNLELMVLRLSSRLRLLFSKLKRRRFLPRMRRRRKLQGASNWQDISFCVRSRRPSRCSIETG